MVSQFVSPDNVNLLCDIDFYFPAGIHAVGRLDSDSEGLLLLTTNKKVTRLLFQGSEKHDRVYLVQVNNSLTESNLQRLRSGVTIRIKGNEIYLTPPCKVIVVNDPLTIYPVYLNPVEYAGVNTWLLITLNEGKYHQVRKMIAAVHHRCKRLIRISIEDITLNGLEPGAVSEIPENDFFEKLKI